MSRRPSSDSVKSSSSGMTKRGVKSSIGSDEFNWDKHLQQSGLPAASPECFKQQVIDDSMPNKFQLYDKLEAKDPRNLAAISVATVVQIQGPRLCLRLDGTDGCNDFWRLIDSKDIFPIGTCEAHGGLLQPPVGFIRKVSTWASFLNRTFKDAHQASSDCFYQEPEGPKTNLFEIGMKLEAVDKKNPQLICPATIGDVDGDQVYVSFDGLRGSCDYWDEYTSRDLFPVGWCQSNNHLLQAPGKMGDNPKVVEKLKIVAVQSKRQTRSVKSNLEQKPLVKETPIQVKEKPVRRRRVDSIKASKQDEILEKTPESEEKDESPSCSSADLPSDDGSLSSDDSETSNDASPDKQLRMNTSEDGSSSSTYSGSIIKKDATPFTQYTSKDLKKIERKVRKQKRKQRKLAKALKRAGIVEGQIGEIKEDSVAVSLNLTSEQIALLASPKKYGAESDYMKSKLKKKKKKRQLIETNYTRMEGFGPKGNELPSSSATSSTTPASPSFLGALATPPTSLFGGDKSRIVRDATQGWPARLQIGSVVTSDNKLGRFDKTPKKRRQENFQDPPTLIESITSHCVSTTSTEGEQRKLSSEDSPPNSADRITRSPFVTSTTSTDVSNKEHSNEDVNKVSSTTNPPSSQAATASTSADTSLSSKVTSTVGHESSVLSDKLSSRNPHKWTTDDVMTYVGRKEPALQNYVAVFKKHEIDGKAFLLLNSTNIVKYMGLKLGPTLKLCNLVEKLKSSLEKHTIRKAKK